MIEIVPYRDQWPSEFTALAAVLRSALGDRALAIHHIGSTSVVGLAAKDVIDVQITVAELDLTLVEDLVKVGCVHFPVMSDHCPPGAELEPDQLSKLLVKGPGRPANFHIRVLGRFNQRYPLLCRDYLRSHPLAATAYATIKHHLAQYFPENTEAYYDIKDPVFDVIMVGANEWAEQIGWQQPATDG